ncbi:hypothetical protein BLIN9172_03203 [Brevibacterium linens ATCC 9172]|uniref:ANTAR domain-containing protein n=1 Tax=Brevibacterium linens ATCC 9172 TaxID=1255617 RepID=A0A2H1KHX8_BRELN|nr:hypothetical protein BLIN9172_03203 [Brevibacterium linens ATCC 9172]
MGPTSPPPEESPTIGRAHVRTRAAAPTARDNIRPIGTGLSRDEFCLRVIRGTTMHNRQLIAISALAHASLSIIARALAVDGGSAADGPDESPA